MCCLLVSISNNLLCPIYNWGLCMSVSTVLKKQHVWQTHCEWVATQHSICIVDCTVLQVRLYVCMDWDVMVVICMIRPCKCFPPRCWSLASKAKLFRQKGACHRGRSFHSWSWSVFVQPPLLVHQGCNHVVAALSLVCLVAIPRECGWPAMLGLLAAWRAYSSVCMFKCTYCKSRLPQLMH